MRAHLLVSSILSHGPIGSNSSAVIGSIRADGWQAAGYASPATRPGDVFAVSSPGFDQTGAVTSYTRNIRIGTRVRRAYPNDGTDAARNYVTTAEGISPANAVALSTYTYAGDVWPSGIVNNSTETSPKPYAVHATPDRLKIGTTVGAGSGVEIEFCAWHRNPRAGKMIAAFKVRFSDGTNVVDVTIADPVVSTRASDKKKLTVYRLPSTNLSSLAAGLITMTSPGVYPWLGDATNSIRTTNAAGEQREFSPRYFWKTTAAPIYVVIATTAVPSGGVSGGNIGTGNDTTGVASTTLATAEANPCLTLVGAIAKLNTLDGKIDNGVIYVVDSVAFGTGALGCTQNIAAPTITRHPNSTRANANLQLSASWRPKVNAGLNASLAYAGGAAEACFRFTDVKITRSGAFTFTGETANQMHVILDDVDFDNGSQTAQILANSHLSIFGATVTNSPTTTSLFKSTGGLQNRIFRGVSCDRNNAPIEGWLSLACVWTRIDGMTTIDPTKGLRLFCNSFPNPNVVNLGAGGIGGTTNAGETINDVVILQNEFEVLATGGGPIIRLSADLPQHGNTYNCMIGYNTGTGYGSSGRYNIFYDWSTIGEVRTHRLAWVQGDIISQFNSKGDGASANALNIGQFPLTHGVDTVGNWGLFQNNSQDIERQVYPGVGSNIGLSTTVMNDPGFINYQGASGAGTGAGGGNYRLSGGGAARGIVPEVALLYDLDGATRPTTNGTPGAYV